MEFLADQSLLLTLIPAVLLTTAFITLHLRVQRLRRLRRHHTLQQLTVLRPLIADLQRHRGLSNGVLAGDDSMRPDLDHVRRSVDQHLQQANALKAGNKAGWQGITDHWSRLRDHKTSDPANNLKQHHLIIRNAIFLLEDIARDIELGPNHINLASMRVVWRDVVQAAEWAGQARALGTGMAASGHSTAAQRVRMRFLYQKMQQLSDSAFTALQQPNPEHAAVFGQCLPSCQQAVSSLLHCIDQELLAQEQPSLSAKDYFQEATATIDELFALVDAALAYVQSTVSNRAP